MRILYIDIDSLRPDHLGCYGYHRDTSPHIDRIAAQGVRFDHVHTTDAPCLPSRSALFSGRCGFHTGVIGHGGTAGQPFVEGPARGFRDRFGSDGWMACLRKAGLRTATVSPFGERHAAWHWYAGFNDIINTGRGGQERAEEILPEALGWLDRRGASDHWFLHVNFWDPHTLYDVPREFGDPFAEDPLPVWYTEDIRAAHWEGCGPHSAQEVLGYGSEPDPGERAHRQPARIDSMAQARRMFDGYDTGVRYADHHVGLLLEKLESLGVLDDTVVIISSDHGENLGELNIYGDHQTADAITTRVPLIVRWPGVTDAQAGRADRALHYHYDFAATMIELLGGAVPASWDGQAFTAPFQDGRDEGRPYLVVSQGAWSCQRAVRFGDHICIRSYHEGHHGYPDLMLFNLADDPHEQHNLADEQPGLVHEALARLDDWHAEMMRTATHPVDPMMTVLREGGPFHTRGKLPAYLKRLEATGRGHWAEWLRRKHPQEC